MKTVLPTQGNGAIEWGGVPLAVLLAIAAVIAVSAILWALDCHAARQRRHEKPEPSDEDRNLDRLAMEVDRHLDDRARRRGRAPITDPILDPVQTLALNSPRRRAVDSGGGWPT